MKLGRARRKEAPTERILFPFLGASISRAALEATLRLARAENATLVPAYLAMVPMHLSLEAPIPQECDVALPLLEAIEHRASQAGVPVDSRIERGRTPRHALEALIRHERYDRIVVPARTNVTEGFEPEDIAWLLESAPGEIVAFRPDVRQGAPEHSDRLALGE